MVALTIRDANIVRSLEAGALNEADACLVKLVEGLPRKAHAELFKLARKRIGSGRSLLGRRRRR